MSDLIPRLPRKAWILLGGDALSAFGNGLVLPFLVIYFHRVRGIDLEIAALSLSTMALVGLVASPVSGSLVDRIGSRKSLILALIVSALGSVMIALVREPWHAFAAAAVSGLGTLMFWPAAQSLLSTVVAKEQRSSVFSVHYLTINLGIGVGGLTGGLLADVGSASSFELLYVIDACSFLVFVAILLKIKDVGGRVEEVDGAGVRGYRTVFRDRIFVKVWLLMMLVVIVGYSQLEAAFPPYSTGPGGISTRALGFAFAANTFTIVMAQLVVLKKMSGRRRTRAIALLFVMWMGAWSITLIAGSFGASSAAFLFALGMVFFALGETLLSPTIPAIVNDLAPDELRGRYNAVYTTAWSIGHIVGPAIAGFMLAARLGRTLFGGLVVVCGFGAYLALRLERHLPVDANVLKPPEAEPPAIPQVATADQA